MLGRKKILPGDNTRGRKQRTLLQRIVNVFLYSGIVLLALFMVFFATSQTAYFRNYLKDFIVDNVNNSINGKLSIGELRGTIFTTLTLRNTVITMQSDTLLNAEKIEVKTSPLEIFLKKIYIRKAEIANADIKFIEDSTGRLNLSKLIKPAPEDTAHSRFPFTIVAPDFALKNVNFTLQSYKKSNSTEYYDSLNLDDLRIRNINLDLSASVNITDNEFEAELNKLSFTPNLNNFDIKNISGKLKVNEKGLAAEDLKIQTGGSEIKLTAQLKNYNVFDTTGTAELKKSFVSADVDGEIDLQDLGAFVSVFRNSAGRAEVSTNLSGKMNDILISGLELTYLDTHLQTKGWVHNLDEPKNLNLKLSFLNSYINGPDIVKLLPDLNVPDYEKLGQIKIDTLNFDGSPLDFETKIYLKTGAGDIYTKGSANFKKPLASYNFDFSTFNFDALPILGLSTKLTTYGKIKGTGTSPKNLTADLSISADGSVISGIKMDSLRLTVNADKKNILYNLKASSDTSTASLSGIFDFTDEKNPGYDIEGTVRNLDYSKMFNDPHNSGILNFYLNGTGQNLDPDKMNLYLSLVVTNSVMNNVKIDSSKMTFNIMSLDNEQKSLNITSDLADISVNGKFSLPKTISLLTDEAGLLTSVSDNKIQQLLGRDTVSFRIDRPSTSAGPSVSADRRGLTDHRDLTGFATSPVIKKSQLLKNKKAITRFSSVDQDNGFTFNIKLKDFNLISIFLRNELEIDGQINGKIYNSNDSVHIAVNTNLEYLKFWGPKDIFFLSKMKLGLDLSNSFYAENIDDISAKINLATNRVFTGSDIHNFLLSLSLNRSKANIKFSGGLENYLLAKLQGQIDLSQNKADFVLDTLGIIYNDFNIHNKGNLVFSVSNDEINFTNFQMVRNEGSLNIKGNLLRNGSQNLLVTLNNFKGKDLASNFAELSAANSPGADINLSALINGNYTEPEINMQLDVDSISFKNKMLGRLTSSWQYRDKNLGLNILFLDSLNSKVRTPLRISGNIPMDFAFTGAGERLLSEKSMDLKIKAEEFNLSILGDMLPQFKKVSGFLFAGLNIKGSFSEPDPYGFIRINGLNFISETNNLEYNAGVKINLAGQSVVLDSLLVQNAAGTPNGGSMTGSGRATLKNFELTSSQFYLNGQLKILSEASKAASPGLYGDLVVATNGKTEFTIDSTGAYLKAPITVVSADLTIPQAQRGYRNSAANFIYKYTTDTTTARKREIGFENLIALSQQRSSSVRVKPSGKSKFDYSISISIEKEAKITFVLDQEFNQILTTALKGDFKFQRINDHPYAVGELKLVEGSTLEFLTKTFQAEGSLRFENELTNPYLDIVATYKNYYYPPSADSSKSSNEVEVAVKLKLKGPLKDLGKNFIKNENNLAVYYGSDNIENDIPDKTKDASDAVTFIVTGQFLGKQGGFVSGSSQNNAFTGTASSIAGSLLGGFLNSYAGDYVRSVELRSVGSYTRFNLSGRVNNFRYSFGGTTDVFSDLSRANVKIEYPFFQKLLLRLERKEAITQTNNTSQMVNELGLKYKFEF